MSNADFTDTGTDPGRRPPLKQSRMYTVYVDDNYHYRDNSDRYKFGEFDMYRQAGAAAEKIVDESLASLYKFRMTEEEVLNSYKMFGKDPFIIPDKEESRFSAWTYAQQHCRIICTTGAQIGILKKIGNLLSRKK